MLVIEGRGEQHMLIFERGEKLMAGLTEFANNKVLLGGHISGIGAITNVELGAYDLNKKDYYRKLFNAEDYELISLTGSFAKRGEKILPHIHVGLGDHNFQQFGGHLFEAEVSVTVEIYIHPLGILPIREYSEKIGLDLICKF